MLYLRLMFAVVDTVLVNITTLVHASLASPQLFLYVNLVKHILHGILKLIL